MNLQAEYELDFHGWINHNLALLKQGRLQEVDLDHLIEELEYMANQDKNTLASRFIILIAHLLKWQFQLKQWIEYIVVFSRSKINEQRTKITFHLENSPSLKKHLQEAVEKAYPKALSLAIKETKLPAKTFPKTCPYSIEQLLDDSFYPISE